MRYRTKSEKFVVSKKQQWQQLYHILNTINNNGGFQALSEEEILSFPRLFRLTCADLAEAKMLQLSPDVLDYLNQLVGQAHKFLYSFPPLKKNQIKSFFLDQLPFIIIKNWMFVLLSAFIFFSSYAVTYSIVNKNPAIAGVIVPHALLQQMEQSYREKINEERSISLKNLAVSFYIQNNISIAFGSFALGVLFGIGTIYILIYNGIFLGAISGYIISLGYRNNFFTFVTAHSVAEITGLILAGSAGLVLGFSIIKATRYYRKEWLALQRHNIFSLVAASAFLLLLAAFIEGVISPSMLAYQYKAIIAVLSWTMISVYFIIWPFITILRQRKKQKY